MADFTLPAVATQLLEATSSDTSMTPSCAFKAGSWPHSRFAGSYSVLLRSPGISTGIGAQTKSVPCGGSMDQPACLESGECFENIAGLARRSEKGIGMAGPRKPFRDPDRFEFPLRAESGLTTASILGSRGCYYSSGETRERFLLPATRVPVVDTTAAGDCFVAALSVALCEGQPIRKALEFANAAAFLASPAASYITGVMLTVDGGMVKGTF